ncbi:MAG TPA: glycine betaine ABC transporter substrate-binding protein [Pseudomonadales bacterium]
MTRRRIGFCLPLVLACVLAACSPFARAAETIVVGSKNFNEGYLLAEMAARLLERAGFPVERRFGLGGTLVCYRALAAGEIDVYIEYTGTISQAILNLPVETSLPELRDALGAEGIRVLTPLGFDNTYALAMTRERAEALGIERIGDLAGATDLKLVVSHEFLERADGWPGLSRAYGLDLRVTGIEHGLAYRALADGAIDVTDAYSTDGEIERYGLVLLEDDRGFFPEYLAVPLARSELPAAAIAALQRLGGLLDDDTMQRLNAAVVFEQRPFAEVAGTFLAERGLLAADTQDRVFWSGLWRNTARHLQLTAVALAASVVAAVALALLVFRHPFVSRAVVYFCGLLQTVPSIALLALMIPLFGIGVLPAIVALFLYSLLPTLRNSVAALTAINPTLLRVAEAMGMTRLQQLRYVYVPLSLPSMLAGIRTAAVISIGTATLAAFIGAGGLGDPIVTGLALNDTGLILQGAVPAAVLAILTELAFEALERVVLPGHLRAAR